MYTIRRQIRSSSCCF